jgi:hypothetical protein
MKKMEDKKFEGQDCERKIIFDSRRSRRQKINIFIDPDSSVARSLAGIEKHLGDIAHTLRNSNQL